MLIMTYIATLLKILRFLIRGRTSYNLYLLGIKIPKLQIIINTNIILISKIFAIVLDL
jgi:hypothetical protein